MKIIENLDLINKTFQVKDWEEYIDYCLTDEEKKDLENWMSLSINEEWEITYTWTRVFTEEEIKKETEQKLLAKFPIYKQINALRNGIKTQEEKDMFKEIDEERKKCNDEIKKLSEK